MVMKAVKFRRCIGMGGRWMKMEGIVIEGDTNGIEYKNLKHSVRRGRDAPASFNTSTWEGEGRIWSLPELS